MQLCAQKCLPLISQPNTKTGQKMVWRENSIQILSNLLTSKINKEKKIIMIVVKSKIAIKFNWSLLPKMLYIKCWSMKPILVNWSLNLIFFVHKYFKWNRKLNVPEIAFMSIFICSLMKLTFTERNLYFKTECVIFRNANLEMQV